ncbi:PHB depolymerase family esterase [Kineosporia succinea]
MTHDSVEIDGRTRTFMAVGPQSPLIVLVFHGSRQSGAAHRTFTGHQFDRLTGHGARVVYLDGYRGNWNDARKESFFPARTANVDDVAFTRAVIEKLGARKVFAVGYSNGGQMVMRLIHEAPGLLGGAMIIAATLPAPENFLAPTEPVVPLPVILIHGTKDPIVSYRGGEMSWLTRTLFKVGGRTLSMPETARYFAARNGITTPPETTALPTRSTTTSVERTSFSQPERLHVALYTVNGGGHTVPGPGNAPALVVGRTHRDGSAADLLAGLLRDERTD